MKQRSTSRALAGVTAWLDRHRLVARLSQRLLVFPIGLLLFLVWWVAENVGRPVAMLLALLAAAAIAFYFWLNVEAARRGW